MKKRAVGLEIADRAIYLVELIKEREIIINHWQIVDLPLDIIENGEIKDLSVLRKKISSLLPKRISLNPIPIIVGISGIQTFVRKFKIPKVPLKEMDKIVRWEGENILPYPITEFFYNYQIIDQSDDDCQILFAALHRDRLNKYLQLFKELKVPVQFLTLQPFGLVNYVEFIGEFSRYSGVLARVRSRSFDFILLYEGIVELVRSVSLFRSGEPKKPILDIFISELISTLRHFKSLYNLWLNTGLFFGEREMLNQIRLKMPSFHWRHLQVNISTKKPLPYELAQELPCAVGLGFMGVI
ncbi:hypothetical protein BBF96_09295 [Anoxybacter fermentans]|uniref:Pilus assembly protein PilM n=1 Tax=Anoxybacter fermentans TaxID=1323375 RepID=A0A3Q9HQY3_9FIRM|nr:pilus assembly protein PilM [Anoxybacter fermentans]AZR73566.1 hypothetical protein BBF96_09295 [Anoxybacter fermentans]